MQKPTDADLENRFLYHSGPPSRNVKHAKVSDLCLALAKELRDLMPVGHHFDQALDHLALTRMLANAALACDSPEGE